MFLHHYNDKIKKNTQQLSFNNNKRSHDFYTCRQKKHKQQAAHKHDSYTDEETRK